MSVGTLLARLCNGHVGAIRRKVTAILAEPAVPMPVQSESSARLEAATRRLDRAYDEDTRVRKDVLDAVVASREESRQVHEMVKVTIKEADDAQAKA